MRARIVYFTQIGYATKDDNESWELRISRGRDYLYCMTGRHPTDAEVQALSDGVMAAAKAEKARPARKRTAPDLWTFMYFMANVYGEGNFLNTEQS